MPRKRDMDKSYGEKVIRLFASLLFAGVEFHIKLTDFF